VADRDRSGASSTGLLRALAYPYERPAGSFTFRPGRGVTGWDGDRAALAGRRPVLAIGSNAAPEQLARKFAGTDDPIPVLRTRLRDHDVVYAARVTAYGAIPATLSASPGTSVELHATFLTVAQRARMDTTESTTGSRPGYRVASVPPGCVECDVPLDEPVEVYLAARGALVVDGSSVALGAVAAERRHLPAWGQAEALAWVARLVDRDVAAFVRAVTSDADLRERVRDRLAALAS